MLERTVATAQRILGDAGGEPYDSTVPYPDAEPWECCGPLVKNPIDFASCSGCRSTTVSASF